MRVVSIDAARRLTLFLPRRRVRSKHARNAEKPSARAPKIECGRADSTENGVRSAPNQIARFKLPSSEYTYTSTVCRGCEEHVCACVVYERMLV